MENFISSSTHRSFRQSSFASLPHPRCSFPSAIFDARLIDKWVRFTLQTSIPIERNKSNNIFQLIQLIKFPLFFLSHARSCDSLAGTRWIRTGSSSMTFPTTRIPTSLPVPPYGTRVAHGFPTSTCINHEVRGLDLPAEHRLFISFYLSRINPFRFSMYSPLTIISSDITESFAKKKERKKERKKKANKPLWYTSEQKQTKRKEIKIRNFWVSVHWNYDRKAWSRKGFDQRIYIIITRSSSLLSFNVTFFNDWSSFLRGELVERETGTGDAGLKNVYLNHQSGSGLGGRRSTMPLEGVSLRTPPASPVGIVSRSRPIQGGTGKICSGCQTTGKHACANADRCVISHALFSTDPSVLSRFVSLSLFLSLSFSLSLSRPRSKWDGATRRRLSSIWRVPLCQSLSDAVLYHLFFPLSFPFFREGGGWRWNFSPYFRSFSRG